MSVMSQCYSIIIDQGISAPGHGKEVVDGLNAVDKRYIYELMSTVKLPVSKKFDSQMQIHTGNQKYDISLAEEIQQHLTKDHRKNSVFDQNKKNKRFTERQRKDRQYHVQDNADVTHKYSKIYCNTNQFPELPFFVPHSKTHGARRFSKKYHLRFDPKLGNGVCEIRHIPCACVAHT